MASGQGQLPTECTAIDADTVTLLTSGRVPGARAEALLEMDPIWGIATKVRVKVRWNEAGRSAGLHEGC